MAVWSAIVAVAVGALGYLTGDLTGLLSGLVEIGLVVGLFALICAAEAYN